MLSRGNLVSFIIQGNLFNQDNRFSQANLFNQGSLRSQVNLFNQDNLLTRVNLFNQGSPLSQVNLFNQTNLHIQSTLLNSRFTLCRSRIRRRAQLIRLSRAPLTSSSLDLKAAITFKGSLD